MIQRLGASLVKCKSSLASAIERTLASVLDDRVSIKDFGAVGDGVTDDTAAIDAACASVNASIFKRRLYAPNGDYIYNGTGMVLPADSGIIGESMLAIINAKNNTNSGYLITLTGWRGRVESLSLYGNKNNPDLKGISSQYNTDNGGVVDCLLQDFTYGIDIDKCWYSVYQNIRFRVSDATKKFTGAHIRIGFNQPTQEVNNLQFSNIWMSEDQQHSVAVYCPNQNLSWNGCSFETKGGPRIKFYSTNSTNTFNVNGSYIEGNTPDGGIAAIEATGYRQKVTLNNCMIRLVGTNTYFAKSATVVMRDCFAQAPNVSLLGQAGKYQFFGSNQLNFKDQFTQDDAGEWDTAFMNSRDVYVAPRKYAAQEYNAIIPKFINIKTHTAANSDVAFFDVFLPAGTGSREMLLEITTMVKGLDVAYVQGVEKYLVTITLPQAATAGSGVHVGVVHSSTKDGAAMLANPSISVVDQGYDSVTDSNRYTIQHRVANPTRLGRVTMTMEGVYVRNAALSVQSEKWKVRKL